jgi:hypothetical protein
MKANEIAAVDERESRGGDVCAVLVWTNLGICIPNIRAVLRRYDEDSTWIYRCEPSAETEGVGIAQLVDCACSDELTN